MSDFIPPRKDPVPLSVVRQDAVELAKFLDEENDDDVLEQACARLCNLFGESIQVDRIQAILDANVVPKLVDLLLPSKSIPMPISVQTAALQVLGNVACGEDEQTQVVIESEALSCLRSLLGSPDRSIRKEVCWILSNITESSQQVQDVIDADLIPRVLQLIRNGDVACREDAAWILCNISSKREPHQIAYLADKNCVRELCNLLTCSNELDVPWKGCETVAAVALKGLRNILICGQKEAVSDALGCNRMAALVVDAYGAERITVLTEQTPHISDNVRKRAYLLLQNIFGTEPTTLGSTHAQSTLPIEPTLAAVPPPSPTQNTGNSSLLQQDGYIIPTYETAVAIEAALCNLPHRALTHMGCLSCYVHNLQHYPVTVNYGSAGGQAVQAPSSSMGDHYVDAQNALGDSTGSPSESSADSNTTDEGSDSDSIPEPPSTCNCHLRYESSPLSERRLRVNPIGEASSFEDCFQGPFHSESSRICDFCFGVGQFGDGRANLAAKFGRSVRLGHAQCTSALLSRMSESQQGVAANVPARLYPSADCTVGIDTSLPAVILAADLGKMDCLALLLHQCKADLNKTYGQKQYTPLAMAACRGYLLCTQVLLHYGADPSAKCGEGLTALHLAAKGVGNITICKMLIEHKAPVNALTERNQSPLCLASTTGNAKVIEFLLKNGSNPNNEDLDKCTPVHITAMNGFAESLRNLLESGANVNCKTMGGLSPLDHAVRNGRPACLRVLISAGSKLDSAESNLLLVAAEAGSRAVLQILLDSATFHIDSTASTKAFLGDNEISDYMTPLHVAASRGKHEVVELLLRRGASIDGATVNCKWTALDFAILNGHDPCAVVLLKHGATVSDNCKFVGPNNWTLQQYASSLGAGEVGRLLTQRMREEESLGATQSDVSGLPTEPAEADLMSFPWCAHGASPFREHRG